ncbi:MAG: lipopolysaccharide biosynthesis protein [Novosphingobium sp.]
MKSLKNLGRTRLAQGTAAGIFGLGIQLAIQLVSVPVLTRSWGLAGYGVWVLLYSVPALLAMADLGLTSAGTSAMTRAVAQGDQARAARIMMALRVITLATGLVLLGAASLVVLLVFPHALDFGAVLPRDEARLTALSLALYGFLALFNGVTIAGFVSTDAFAKGGFLYQTVIMIEALAALAVAASGGTQAEVALAFLVMRLIGTAVQSLALRRHAPWLRSADWRIDRDEVRTLIRPALAALVLPGAQAIGIQGSVMAIGAFGGPAAIPAFSVVRTLSRTALQFAFRFNIAAMPRYNVYVSHHDEARANQLLVLNLGVMAVLVIPAALGLLLLGRPFIQLWTGGMVVPGMALLAVMVATMLADAVWGPLSNLILAINRHASFTYFFLAASVVCVAVGALLVKPYGAIGMAWALFALEVIMIVQVWLAARRLGMVSREKLRSGAAGLIAELRHRRSSLDNPDI